MNHNYKLYCDLDEVLIDFMSYVEHVTGIDRANVDELLPNWRQKHMYTEELFFYNMDLKDDAEELISFLNDHFPGWEVLTSAGIYSEDSEQYFKKIALEKNLSVWKKIGKKVNCNVVKQGILKASYTIKNGNYAPHQCILIDDQPKNVAAWRTTGGYAILHTSTDETIKELNTLLNEARIKNA